MGNVINLLDSSNAAFISCVGLGKLCALHCIKVSFYMYHNNFLYLLKRYITVQTFSTRRKNIFQLHCISRNGISLNHWHQIFSSLGSGGEKKGGVFTALRSLLPQGGYYNMIFLCSEQLSLWGKLALPVLSVKPQPGIIVSTRPFILSTWGKLFPCRANACLCGEPTLWIIHRNFEAAPGFFFSQLSCHPPGFSKPSPSFSWCVLRNSVTMSPYEHLWKAYHLPNFSLDPIFIQPCDISSIILFSRGGNKDSEFKRLI